jgi:hypothetical protein
MTGTSNKNWLFSKNSPVNTLILDAHLTVHHLNVQKYASEKVWEAAVMKMEWDESEQEHKKVVRSQFADRSTEKRKFGEKTKRSKKKLQKQGKAFTKAKPKYRLEKAYTMASCSFSS